jgi:hypothetical protein
MTFDRLKVDRSIRKGDSLSDPLALVPSLPKVSQERQGVKGWKWNCTSVLCEPLHLISPSGCGAMNGYQLDRVTP